MPFSSDGSFTAAFPSAVGPGSCRPYSIGDVDGDTKTDIAWWHSSSGMTAMWYMNGGQVADDDFLSRCRRRYGNSGPSAISTCRDASTFCGTEIRAAAWCVCVRIYQTFLARTGSELGGEGDTHIAGL